MEDFLSMILLMVIYIGVAAANGNKKKKKRAKQARARGFQPAFDGRSSAGGERRVQQPESAQEGFLPAFEDNCESRPIHLHDVPQSVLQHAGEGEDPCHAGGARSTTKAERKAKEAEPPFAPDEAEGSEFAQDVLRGVIMSEILTRPCDRRAMRRNGRSV